MGTTIETRISGIPCIVEITSYYPARSGKWFRDGSCAAPEYEELEFVVLDRKGYPAPWLERKMDDHDRNRIVEELRKQMKYDDEIGYY